MKVFWTEAAQVDLEGVYRFFAQVNKRAAIRIHNKILDEAGLLAIHPKLGKLEPLLDDFPGGYRSLVVGRSYKIVYNVIALLDCRRDPTALRRTLTEKEN